MSGASRKVKNPLLSAAGDGFPFENYGENALLVPVTPTTPAVLRDDAELEAFVGQETANSQPATLSTPRAIASTELTNVPLHTENTKSPAEQPIKQGYFTSILSSLPNLSLSSITGDSPSNQGDQGISFQGTKDSHVPSHDDRNPLRGPSSNLNPDSYDSRRANLLGSEEVNIGGIKNLSTPPQPSLPPTATPPTDGPISYRLGNQRRLKYAPPPDLTSSSSKQCPPPTVQTFFHPQSTVAPPTILNPNELINSTQNYRLPETSVSTNPPPLKQSTYDQLSQSSSLQGSFTSSPIATGVSHNSTGSSGSVTPQNQSSFYDPVAFAGRTGVSVSTSRPIPSKIPEPATPQNTPANFSFPGFELYATQRNSLATSNSDKESSVIENPSQSSSGSQILGDNISASTSGIGTPPVIPGISAVKVTERLENLLAEQKEHSPEISAETIAKVDDNTAAENRVIETTDEVKLNEAPEKVDLSKHDSLTDVFLGEEPVESITSQGVYTANEKINVSQRHAVTSNVEPFPQSYQPQLSFPPHSTFFPEKQADQKVESIKASQTDGSVLSSFPDSSKTLQQSASSFFESSQNVPSFPPFQSTGNNGNTQVDIIPTYPTNVIQQPRVNPSFGSHSVSSPFAPPQSAGSANPNSHVEAVTTTCSTSAQRPPPLFYNPTQLPSELYTHPPLARTHKYLPPTEQSTVNQTHHYFGNLPAPGPAYNITSGNGTVFPPACPPTSRIPGPTNSATLNPVQMSVNPHVGRTTPDAIPPSLQNLAAGPSDARMQYRKVYHHWFYRKEVEHKVLWCPFSMQDSLRLEEVHNSSEITPETKVATDGGRYDVDILRRQRFPAYWSGPSTEVRRCSWFYKGATESRYVPYDESTAAKLEEEYKQVFLTNNWNRRIDLSNGEYIIFHSATVQVHYITPNSPELAASWGNSAGAASRPRVIKRGLDEFHIEDGEPEKVDHLLFIVHGIGSVCDLKFRNIEEVVDEFRSISLQLVQSHYRTASEQQIVNRIEVLPISWHARLHSEDTGIDKKIQAITLESIPKLRHFTNDSLLDILFYTSPIFCQTIMETVVSEMNRLHALFKERNPNFNGQIYLGGHSLGSLIVFDLLCHQKPLVDESADDDDETNNDKGDEDVASTQSLAPRVLKRRLSKKISYIMGAAGTGQPYIHYPQLNFHPRAFFAMGSPIGMFVTVRGIDILGEDFVLPTCPAFFNVFHPFDPVAYRVEALINPEAQKVRPMLIPHHKGRKRMHLELKETMARVGADLKQKLLDSVRNTWNSVYQLALFHKPDNHALEREIDKVVEEQLQQSPTVPDPQNNDDGGADFKVGKLNGGRRIDYVLQEAPFEYINEYIFALTSHVGYWESEDTILMILKEMYGSAGIQADAQLPPQTLSIERASPSSSSVLTPPSSSKSDTGSSAPLIGVDPTAPISEKFVGPPPKTGFVRKS